MPKARHLRNGEPTQRKTFSLTQSEINGLTAQAQSLEVSVSRLVGMLGRKELPLASQQERLLGESLSS